MGGQVSIMEGDIQDNRLSVKGGYMTGFCYGNSELLHQISIFLESRKYSYSRNFCV